MIYTVQSLSHRRITDVPAWPRSQAALSHLTNTLDVLSHESFLASLYSDSSSDTFPSLALVHTLCALGATIGVFPPSILDYWQMEASSPWDYHACKARLHLQHFSTKHILDDIRAALILSVYSFSNAEFSEVWNLVGMACRALPTTGLTVSYSTCLLETFPKFLLLFQAL